MRERVLLLNPPGRRRYLRDGYCSCTSKGSYYYHPLDLLVQSGHLHASSFDVRVIDAIVERIPPERAVGEIVSWRPEAILILTGAVSHAEDFALAARLRRLLPETLLVGCGDVLLFEREACLGRYPSLDAVLVDFLDPTLGASIREGLNGARRGDGRRIVGLEPTRRDVASTFSYPPPRYDLFPQWAYRIPFGPPGPFGSVLTSMGCPFACSFCNTGRITYRQRDLDNVMDEFAALATLGVRKVYLRDPTFGVRRVYATEFLDRLAALPAGFAWNCFTRADLVDPDLLAAMKRAGCYLVQYGIESADAALLDRFGKSISPQQIERAVRFTREAGIGVLGTFVLGLPGESRASALETARFAARLGLDYASFNVAIPRLGTPLRDELLAGGMLVDEWASLDSSRGQAVFETPTLTGGELRAMRNRAIRTFYLRPGYLASRVRASRGVPGFLQELRNGAALFRSLLPW